MTELHHCLLAQARKDKWLDTHEIKRIRFGLWHCAKPGTRMGSFNVAYNGSALVVFGDLGEMILLPNDANAFRWAKNTTFNPENPYYPLTKLSPQMRDKEFQADEALAYLKERVEECKTSTVLDERDLNKWTKMLKEWEEYPHDEHWEQESYWHQLWSDHDLDDPADCRSWTPRVLWVYTALCWFMGKVEWEDPRFKEELHEHTKGAVPR